MFFTTHQQIKAHIHISPVPSAGKISHTFGAATSTALTDRRIRDAKPRRVND